MSYTSKNIPDLPEELKNIIRDNTDCDITLFGDSGKRYRVVKLYDAEYHQKYDVRKSGLPWHLKPLATLQHSNRILCMDTKERLYMVAPGSHPDYDNIRNNISEFIKMLQGEKQTLFLPGNKQKHIVAVAEYMYRNAAKYGLDSDEMYTLGLLHDIGYLYGNVGHAFRGGELMEKQGYKYWQEVKYHGKDQNEYESDALWLLNAADLMVDANGNLVGTKQRMKDIKERYGEHSKNYEFSQKLVKKMKERGFLNEED